MAVVDKKTVAVTHIRYPRVNLETVSGFGMAVFKQDLRQYREIYPSILPLYPAGCQPFKIELKQKPGNLLKSCPVSSWLFVLSQIK